MLKTRKQSTIYLFLSISLLVVFFVLLMAGRLDFLPHRSCSISTEALYENAKDFAVENEAILSESEDPWLDVAVPRGTYKELIIDVSSLNRSSTKCDVFYCLTDNGGYTADQCVSTTLLQQSNSIPLPEVEIDRVRLDLTNEKDVVIGLSKVELIEANTIISTREIIGALCALLLIMLGLIPISAWIAKASVLSGASLRRLIRRMICEKPKVLLAILMSVSVLICFGKYLCGAKYFAFLDIGSDTVYDYQTKWFSMADDFSTGRVAQWTMNYGLGTSTLAQIPWLLDPFLWPTLLAYLLIGFHTAQITVAWMQGLKLILCALLCYDFLSEFSIGNTAKIVASYVYGFCGFVMLWGQHYMFSTYFLISTLVLLFLERSIKQNSLGKQHLYLVLSVAWLAARTYYFTYMSLLAMAVYTVFRLFYVFPIKTIKRLITSGIRVLVSVLLGFLIASVSLLPQVKEVMTVSNRITNSGSLLQYITLDSGLHLKTTLSRMLSNNLFGIQHYKGFANYYEAGQLFFSSFMPLFFVLFILQGLQKCLRVFVIRLVAVAALCLSAITPVTGYIMNAFVAPSWRYTYVYMPICAYISASVIDGIMKRKVTIPKLVLATVPYPLIMLFIYDESGFSRLLCSIILVGLLCGIALMGISKLIPRKNYVIRTLFVIVIMINALADAWLTTNMRTTLDDVYSDSQLAAMTSTVKHINMELAETDPELYRIEKTYTDYSFWNDAMIEDYYGISSYNGTVNGGIREFYKNCWDEVIFYADGIYTQFERDYLNAQMASLLGVKYLIADDLVEETPFYDLRMTTDGKYVYENNEYKGFGRFYTGSMTEEEFLATEEGNRDMLLQNYIILDHHEEPTLSTAQINVSRPTTDDHIEARVNADGNGYLFLPIPYEDGWRATANGSSQAVLKADYGFMAIPVAAGDNEIVLEYHIPMLKQGLLLSMLGLIITVLLFGFRGKRAAVIQNPDNHKTQRR